MRGSGAEFTGREEGIHFRVREIHEGNIYGPSISLSSRRSIVHVPRYACTPRTRDKSPRSICICEREPISQKTSSKRVCVTSVLYSSTMIVCISWENAH